MKQYLGLWRGRCLGALVCGVAIGGAAVLSGCGESETADGLAGPTTQSAEDAGGFGFGPALTLESLPTELGLSEDQRSDLGVAIEEFDAARQEFRSRFRSDHPLGPRGGRRGGAAEPRGTGDRMGPDGLACPDGPAGPGRHVGRGGAGRGGPAAIRHGDVEPPMMTFLSRAAEILDREQFVILAQFLADNRPDRPGRHGGPAAGGERFGDRMAGRLARELGLDGEQVAGLREVVSSYRQQFRDLRAAVRDDQKSADAALAQGLALTSAMKAELAAVLTAEQLETFAEHRAEQSARRIESRLDKLDERMTQRAAMVAAVLDLDDSQAQQTEAVFRGTVAARQEVLSGVVDGSVDPEVAGFQILVIENRAWAELNSLLTPPQQVAWDTLRDLLPAPREGF